MDKIVGLHWFRNDLRLRDNTALRALGGRVQAWLPVFVVDPRLMGGPRARTPRARFLLDCLGRLARDLERRGVPLLVRHGRPEQVLPRLAAETGARLVSWNADTTPFAVRRDEAVGAALERRGVEPITCRDRVVYGADEVRSGSGRIYRVYTPYKRAWWKKWEEDPRPPAPRLRMPPALDGFRADPIPAAAAPPGGPELPTGGEDAARRRLGRFLAVRVADYPTDRDRPDVDGTSRLSPYLRFGALSVRQCLEAGLAAAGDDPALEAGVRKWLDELVWREFYAALAEAVPRVLRQNQRRETDGVRWREDPAGFEAWCRGRTGFPIVDAGMRQLLACGWMHNRVRMIVASFLTKDLLIDWRRGERFFFSHLVDGDPASNSGGWQWAASTGTDAQPYFRVFNPQLQGRRCDPEGRYVRRYVPELAGLSGARIHGGWSEAEPRPRGYPAPIVDHAERRREAVEAFRRARESARP